MAAEPRIAVEVCVDSLDSASRAVNGGADRLEVCANLGLGGGTTPSVGLVRAIQRAFPDIPLMAMVRPRTGDFLYSASEIKVMFEDIHTLKEAGVAGLVFGVLNGDGTVDVQQTLALVEAAKPLQVCFHRAFDMTRDAEEALTAIFGIPGVTRILTSGHGPSAPSSLPTLQRLFQRTQTSENATPCILPGSGISPKTIRTVLDALLPFGLSEVHMSGGRWRSGEMTYRPEGMGMGVGGAGEWGVWETDEAAVREVRLAVDKETTSGQG
ncbi:hypothetical protein FA95DRAFT_568348 [Auriscalpium vulgare]|uniref:Uncharacterized protein n=1 Tax=Auriscalpium vulgare TaxID=40419 RepID=A0ACB8S3A6_9AGAM|nr:hypothetical protein FA95DRAFT_568348 [Auriscalpium vulgare]